VLERLKQERVLGISRLDGIARVTTGLPARTRIQDEATFVFRGSAVAFVALLREDGADAGLKELELLRRWGSKERARNKHADRTSKFDHEVAKLNESGTNLKVRLTVRLHAWSLGLMVSAAWIISNFRNVSESKNVSASQSDNPKPRESEPVR
jgi:hypothetical protein